MRKTVIITTYTCDRCGLESREATQFVVAHISKPHELPKSNWEKIHDTLESKEYCWCHRCWPAIHTISKVNA